MLKACLLFECVFQDSHLNISSVRSLASHLFSVGWHCALPNWILDPLLNFARVVCSRKLRIAHRHDHHYLNEDRIDSQVQPFICCLQVFFCTLKKLQVSCCVASEQKKNMLATKEICTTVYLFSCFTLGQSAVMTLCSSVLLFDRADIHLFRCVECNISKTLWGNSF